MTEGARLQLTAEIADVALGDAGALKRVYDATSAKLYGICRRILPEGDEAADALQDAYLKVWHHAARFDPAVASPITWLCTIARNTALDARRVRTRSAATHEALEQLSSTHEPSSGTASTDADALTVERCLDTLEADQRTAIVSAFYEGFSYSELAESRSVPLGTMKSWIRRGLALLKGCLDND